MRQVLLSLHKKLYRAKLGMDKIKMIDVANRAHVSKSTVSQYLNGRFDYMSQKTREKIELAIKELNYVPNYLARSLKTNKTKTIGVIVRDITGFFTSRVIRGIDDYCKDSKYNVLLYNTDFDPDKERESIKLLKEMHVDGIIIMSSGKNNDLIVDDKTAGLPIVLVQLEFDEVNTSIVVSDYINGAFTATEYLINHGHKRICFVTQEYETYKSRYERLQGYKNALEEYKIPYDKDLIEFWDRETRLKNDLGSILNQSNPPTAFFTQHLSITVDLIKGLNRIGKKIPADISIIGFDELPMVELLKVPITVVAQYPYNMGKESAKILLERINTPDIKTKRVLIPCQLIERESCCKIPNE